LGISAPEVFVSSLEENVRAIVREVVREEVNRAITAAATPAPDEWLSTAQAAAILGVTRHTRRG
jgi:hypothetical protein